MKGIKIKRVIVTALTVCICYMLQCTLFPNLTLASIKPNILIIAPPVIGDGIQTSPMADEMGTMGMRCVEKSRKVPARFRQIAEETGSHFLDANE